MNNLTQRIEDFRAESIGGIFALVGPWGSGKTSLANAAAARLKNDRDWRTATFEPWAYGDYQSMLDGFFSTLRNQLGDKKLAKSKRDTLSKFFRSVAPFGVIGGAFGMPLKDIFSGIAAISAKREDFLSTRAAANKIFRDSPKPILILIEDIDRLDSVELMNCFKLIRLLGELDNVYYLLCYDEKTVVDVMQKTDVIGVGGITRARAYLEKITQVRVDVLELYGEEHNGLWDRQIDEFAFKHGLEISFEDGQRMEQMWREVFKPYLRSPRSLDRFVLQLNSMWKSIAGEVNIPDFVAIAFLRTFETDLFYLIRESKHDLVDGLSRKSGEKRPTAAEARAGWEAKANELDAVDPSRSTYLMSVLFAELADMENPLGYLHFSRAMRVDSNLYFDRYFRNSLAGEDIPERFYRAYLDDVISGEDCEISRKVRRSLSARERTICDRLESELTESDRNSEMILTDLKEQYGNLMSVGALSAPRDDFLVRLALHLQNGPFSVPRQSDWYYKLAEGFGGVALLSELVVEGRRAWLFEPDTELKESDAARMVALIKKGIEGELQKDPGVSDHSVFRGLNALDSLGHEGNARAYIQDAIKRHPKWTSTDVMISLLTVSIKHTTDGPEFTTSKINTKKEIIDYYLGLNWAVENQGQASPLEKPFMEWTSERPAYDDLFNMAAYELGRIDYVETLRIEDEARKVPTSGEDTEPSA